jgi:hypothetical protein
VNSVRFFSDTVKFEAHISESILLINIVKSPTSVARYHVYMFISEGDPHLTSRFCRVELGPIPNSKKYILLFSFDIVCGPVLSIDFLSSNTF